MPSTVHPDEAAKGDTSSGKPAKTTLEKSLMVVAVFLSLAVVGLLIGLIVTATATPAPAQTAEVCTTETCLERSLWIKKAIDNTTDPCVDFYQYACGKWVNTTELPSDKSRTGTFDSISDDVDKMVNTTLLTRAVNVANPNTNAQDKAAFSHQQCVHSDANSLEADIFRALNAVLTNTGGCPILTPGWNGVTFNRTRFMANVQSITRSSFLRISVSPDLKNSTRNRITVQQPALNLPTKGQLLDTTTTTYRAYRQFVFDMFYELVQQYNPTVNNASLTAQIEDMLTFERRLANVTFNSDEIRDESKTYKLVLFRDLAGLYRELIADLVHLLVKETVDPAEYIQVIVGPDFLTNYLPILTSATSAELANYGIWCMLRYEMFQSLPPRVRALEVPLYNALRGSNPSARWSTCLDMFNDYLAFGVGRLYVDYNFDKQIKEDMMQQIDYIAEEFRESSLEKNAWIDAETKKRALLKLDVMGREIAYPDFILDDKLLQEYYVDIVLPSGRTALMVNIIYACTYGSSVRIMKEWVVRIADRKAWFIGPQIVNAFYSPSSNAIYFPGGILYPPFYHRDLPKAMNFGGIGYVIGHEISHGFDDSGRQYDEEGNMLNWWSESSINAFNVRAKCIIDQYSKCCFPNLAAPNCVNGEFTQGENIADNGGMRTSFEAYQRWKKSNTDTQLPGLTYTGDQLFFLTSAHVWCLKQTDQRLANQLQTDPHSPMPYRVNVAVQNLEQFSTAFSCKAGSPMNPADKCRVW